MNSKRRRRGAVGETGAERGGRVFGVDFTSSPRRAKPIVCVGGEITGDRLSCDSLERWRSFDAFEAFLQSPGPWSAAFDFPFGQPRRLVEALGWPGAWPRYVAEVGRLTKEEFCQAIQAYCDRQPAGDKHHRRRTDSRARACSPMMLYGVPVGKMFFEGAPRLLNSGVSVAPCRPNNSGRNAIEGYPALVARRLNAAANQERAKYKNDSRDSPEQSANRSRLLDACRSATGLDAYGVRLEIDPALESQAVDDKTGDTLDAIFCLIQAAAWRRRPTLIPADADPVEGWIVDPTCLP